MASFIAFVASLFLHSYSYGKFLGGQWPTCMTYLGNPALSVGVFIETCSFSFLRFSVPCKELGLVSYLAIAFIYTFYLYMQYSYTYKCCTAIQETRISIASEICMGKHVSLLGTRIPGPLIRV